MVSVLALIRPNRIERRKRMSSETNKVKVMVIDDSNTIRRSAEIFLKTEGYEVFLVEDGFAALGEIVRIRPDIVFIDIMMPKLDGYHACQMIKRNPDFSDLPVIMLSSKDGLFDKAKGRIVGANEYLTKPFKKDDLLEVVKRHFSRPVK